MINFFRQIFNRPTPKAISSGTINTSVFKFITPLMIIILVTVSSIIIASVDTLKVYYFTNIPLNSLILGLIVLTVVQAILGCLNLHRTAKFLRYIDDLSELQDIPDTDIDDLRYSLERKIPLLNTKPMHDSINTLSRFGNITFSDNDARLIKSKLGFRISFMRSSVNFSTGILVMLGLLGTFLGLLKTIDAVGAAMASMSTMGDNFGSEQINQFMGSLSEPLQGMGVAFSSSLFGLSGSLLIGYFNNLCTGSQNKFIENVGRWIDDRIPKFDPTKPSDAPGNKKPDNDDLKSLFAGFLYMTSKTNKQINRLFYALSTAVQNTTAINSQIDQIALNQLQLRDSMTKVSNAFDALSSRGQDLTSYVERSSFELSSLRTDSVEKLTTIEEAMLELNSTFAALGDSQNSISDHTFKTFETLSALRDENQKNAHVLKDVLESSTSGVIDNMNTVAEHMQGSISTVSSDLSKAVDSLPSAVEHGVQAGSQAQVRALDDMKAGSEAQVRALEDMKVGSEAQVRALEDMKAGSDEQIKALEEMKASSDAQLDALDKVNAGAAAQIEALGKVQSSAESQRESFEHVKNVSTTQVERLEEIKAGINNIEHLFENKDEARAFAQRFEEQLLHLVTLQKESNEHTYDTQFTGLQSALSGLASQVAQLATAAAQGADTQKIAEAIMSSASFSSAPAPTAAPTQKPEEPSKKRGFFGFGGTAEKKTEIVKQDPIISPDISADDIGDMVDIDDLDILAGDLDEEIDDFDMAEDDSVDSLNNPDQDDPEKQ